VQPEELQDIGGGLYMERRNIKEIHHEADEETGTEAYTDYECECREITVSEYQMLKSIEDINTASAIDAYTEQLIEEGLL
jgi:hypothetical protein